ncbi:hypothetical protein RU97_GL000591 [Enterococcus canis]|uniref:Uncharacterized protein n=4 Tax=Enterococcus TaxID=1350 RepID=A0A1L8RCE7_9ENTE|nr:hypothetical protein RU97_GL000591 [Enterococcus canis]
MSEPVSIILGGNMMKKKRTAVLLGLSLIFLVLLGACNKNELDTVKSDEIDKIEVTIANEKSTNEQERTATVNDLQEQERIITDLNAVISNEKLNVIDTNKVTPNRHYTIEMYKDNKVIKKYTISKNTLTEGIDSDKKYDVPKKDTDKLNNLKNHLDKIAK